MRDKLKIIGVSLIVFFGTMFAIMSFNEDVAVGDLFDKLYRMIYNAPSNGVIELFYGVGAAVGILIFYNHIGNQPITKDPTPLELKMWQYQQNVDEYGKSQSAGKK